MPELQPPGLRSLKLVLWGRGVTPYALPHPNRSLDRVSCALILEIKEGFKPNVVNLGGLCGRGRFYSRSGRLV